MKRSYDHEKWVGHIQSMAKAEESERKDKREEDHNLASNEKTCRKCDKQKTCKKFQGRTFVTGTYSVGGDMLDKTCDGWKERRNKTQLTPKGIKNLMKQTMRSMK